MLSFLPKLNQATFKVILCIFSIKYISLYVRNVKYAMYCLKEHYFSQVSLEDFS